MHAVDAATKIRNIAILEPKMAALPRNALPILTTKIVGALSVSLSHLRS